MSLFSCTNNDALNKSGEDNYTPEASWDFWNCEQLLDTTGLKLYPFIPFTDEFGPGKSQFTELLAARQIPEDFLCKMSTKELFYQYVYCDLSGTMFLFNTYLQGFLSTTRLNMLPELLNRSDVGHVLLELLQKVDPSNMVFDMSKRVNCFWWDHCLQIILAQPEVINSMTDEDIDQYIQQQIRIHDTIRSLSGTDQNWVYPSSVVVVLMGLGHVMVRYEYEPFMKTFGIQLSVLNELYYWDTHFIKEQQALQLIDFVKQFKKGKK